MCWVFVSDDVCSARPFVFSLKKIKKKGISSLNGFEYRKEYPCASLFTALSLAYSNTKIVFGEKKSIRISLQC